MNSFEHLDTYTEDKRFPKSFINDPKYRADGKQKKKKRDQFHIFPYLTL